MSIRYQFPVFIYEYNYELISSLPKTYHFSASNYARLLIPNVLPDCISKVIYLDSDIICLSDMGSLWETDLADKAFAAIRSLADDEECKNRLGIKGNRYLNSGVLVMNLNLWRTLKYTEKMLRFVGENESKIRWVDQDAIAAIADGDFIELPKRYNNCIDCATHSGEVTDDTVILHFVGSTKPWQSWCSDIRKEKWWSYAKQSMWGNMNAVAPKTLRQKIIVAHIAKSNGNFNEAFQRYDEVLSDIFKTSAFALEE